MLLLLTSNGVLKLLLLKGERHAAEAALGEGERSDPETDAPTSNGVLKLLLLKGERHEAEAALGGEGERSDPETDAPTSNGVLKLLLLKGERHEAEAALGEGERDEAAVVKEKDHEPATLLHVPTPSDGRQGSAACRRPPGGQLPRRPRPSACA